METKFDPIFHAIEFDCPNCGTRVTLAERDNRVACSACPATILREEAEKMLDEEYGY